jgi:predicted RNase H-like nuclease (RuvC/YqgF family)
MSYLEHTLTSAGALIGALGVVLAAVWGIRSKAICLLRADLETYKEHLRILEGENKAQAVRIQELETEVGQLRAATNLSPLLTQVERLVKAIDVLEQNIEAHDRQAKQIASDLAGVHAFVKTLGKE